MNINFKDVVQHIYDYFEEHLPQYTVFEVRKKFYDSENDDYLYMVAAKHKDSSYAVWTWNESIHSLNHGHYGLPDMKTCAEIMSEYQNAHDTDDTESTPLECLQKLLIKHDDHFEDSYHEILYIAGFCDGITAQRENSWNLMTETEVCKLYQEAVTV